jgi:hypothetical protein
MAIGTQTTQRYDCIIEGRQFVLLDTPGFDDTYRGDADILAEIAENLSATYKNSIKISGIVYLHRIKDERMTNAIMRNLSMFKNLCGDDAFKNVTLATTFWDEIPNLEKGEGREKQLVEEKKWWGYMQSKGSRIRRFKNTKESALDIIAELAGLPRVTLQIQTEMVDEGLDINMTTAGEALNSELAAMVAKHAEDLKNMQAQMEQAIKDRDVELQETISEMQAEKRALIEHLQNEQELLRADRREELRRMEQQFNDQLRRMEIGRQASEKEMQKLEERLAKERVESEQRVQEAFTQANEAMEKMKEAMEEARGEERREYQAALRNMKQKQDQTVQERQRWERELAKSNEQIRQLSMAQAGASMAERRRLEERIRRLEIEKQESTTNFWDFITPVAGIAMGFLGQRYL